MPIRMIYFEALSQKIVKKKKKEKDFWKRK